MLQGWPGSLARMNEARGRPGNGPGVARLVGAVALVALTSCLGDVVSADRGVGAPGGTSRERRFLGGTYAVTLPGLPIGSRLVGETEGMTVFEIPTERSSLYVQRGASVERWLPLPSRVSSSTPTAFFIGDSITYGAEP